MVNGTKLWYLPLAPLVLMSVPKGLVFSKACCRYLCWETECLVSSNLTLSYLSPTLYDIISLFYSNTEQKRKKISFFQSRFSLKPIVMVIKFPYGKKETAKFHKEAQFVTGALIRIKYLILCVEWCYEMDNWTVSCHVIRLGRLELISYYDLKVTEMPMTRNCS